MRKSHILSIVLFITTLSPFYISANQPTIDFILLNKQITTLMHQYHYNPKELSSEAYKEMEQKIEQLARTARDKQAFVDGFNQIWYQGPFSHVRLDNARMPAQQMVDYLDTMNVGGSGASLEWRDGIAVLTVNTMMGMDTIEQIFAAYKDISEREAVGLVIDLRANNGGAFAVKPLISHLIQAPLDAGFFISQPWTKVHDRLPTQTEVSQQAPWTGWSIKSFWHDAQNNAITRVQFQPSAPYFSKAVYVLTSSQTASAAELATEALSYIDNVVVVGEVTAGEMLSQKMYDLPYDLQLALPIADYYSAQSGRIEQHGVTPDVLMPADNAMEYALAQLRTGPQH